MSYNRKPHVILLRLAAVLLILVMLTGSMTTGRYGRYFTSASGSDSARVAKFAVWVEGGGDTDISLDMNDESKHKGSYGFTVKNDSEVKVAYTVTVKLPSALPDGVSMTVNLGGVKQTPVQDGNTYTYSSVLDFTDSHEWMLLFVGVLDEVNANTTIEGISVSVAAEQID